jgi:acetyl esterase
MPVKEIARELQGKAANLALRMPISWINILAGPPVSVDGRTLDGRTQWLLQLLARSGQPPIEKTSVVEARAGYDVFMLEMGGNPAPIGEIVDRTIEGATGRLRVRIYRPAGTVARLLPAILYFHGGGWVMGSLEGYDLVCRYICARSGCAVIAVDYRLAPEHKFPAAIDDAVAAFRTLTSEAVGLGIDPARIVIAGDSAGGNLAVVTAMRARDEGMPQPAALVLLSPVLDLTFSGASVDRNDGLDPMFRASSVRALQQYYGTGMDLRDPRLSPLFGRLTGLPPTMLLVGSSELLLDDTLRFAAKVAGARASVWHDMPHVFPAMRGLAAGDRAIREMGEFIRERTAAATTGAG